MTTPLGSAAAAEAAFYRALARGDTALMERVWDVGEGVGCVHPGWPALHGRLAVLASFKRMFDAGQRLELRHERLLARRFDGGVVLHLTHEHIAIPGATQPGAPVVATNLYRRTEAGWRIFWHHASPTPAREDATRVH
jgi:hypothetical protein